MFEFRYNQRETFHSVDTKYLVNFIAISGMSKLEEKKCWSKQLSFSKTIVVIL